MRWRKSELKFDYGEVVWNSIDCGYFYCENSYINEEKNLVNIYIWD